MRTRILTDHERKVIQEYIDADGEKDPLIRSLARYLRSSLEDLHEDMRLLEDFQRTYEGRQAKKGRG